MKYDVFISYSSIDRKAAEAICGYLESNGLRCFIDYRDIPRGAMWARVLPGAIRESGMMLALFSSNYNHSLQVERELSIADKEGMNILPFRLADVPYEGLKSYYFESLNWIDAFPNPEAVFGSVLEGINAMREQSANWTKGRVARVDEAMADHTAPQRVANVDTIDVEALDDNMYDPVYEDDYQEGVDAMRNFDYTEAFDLLFESAMNNYRLAQYYMDRLFNRLGFYHLPSTIWRRILPLAEEGNSFAEYLAGRYYYFYVKHDTDMTYEYAARSARHGNLFGKYEMAKNLDLGTCTERDEAAALELFKELARYRFPLGLLELGRHYLYGYAVRKNPRRGLRYLDEGVALGFAECKYERALAYMFGEGGEVNVAEARRLLTEALDDGYIYAQSVLGDTYLFDYEHLENGYNTPENMRRGLELFHQGIRRGSAGSMDRLGFIYSNAPDGLGIAKDDEQALRWFRRAAEMNYLDSLCALGRAYYYGEMGLNEDEQQAWDYFQKAAYCVSGEAQRMLGMMTMDGYGFDGKTKADCVTFFENSLYLGGYSGGLSAERLYTVYAPDGFDDGFPAPPYPIKHIDGITPSLDDTLRVLRLGAKEDNLNCCYFLGCALTDITRPYANEVEGVELLNRALTVNGQTCWSAALRLADLYRKGLGVPRDTAEADRLEALYRDKTGDNIPASPNTPNTPNTPITPNIPNPSPASPSSPAEAGYTARARKILERMYMSELPDAAYLLRVAIDLGEDDEAQTLYDRAMQRISTLLNSMSRNSDPDAGLLGRLAFAPYTPSNYTDVAKDISNTDAWQTLYNDWAEMIADCLVLKIDVPPLTTNLLEASTNLMRVLLEFMGKVTDPKLKEALRKQPMSDILDIVDKINPDEIPEYEMAPLTSIFTAYISLSTALTTAFS